MVRTAVKVGSNDGGLMFRADPHTGARKMQGVTALCNGLPRFEAIVVSLHSDSTGS